MRKKYIYKNDNIFDIHANTEEVLTTVVVIPSGGTPDARFVYIRLISYAQIKIIR